MESWNNGREQLLEQLTKVCDQIGINLQAELNNDEFTRIGREELELLRKNSASVGSVNEHNQRLVEDIERFRAVAGRVDGLEQENKRLAAELQQQIQARQINVATPKRLIPGEGSKATPASIPPPSTSRIDCDERLPIAPEKYQALVLKFNHLSEEYIAMKQARKTFENRFREELEKNKGWNTLAGENDKTMIKKDEKIKRLEAEVKRLKEAQGLGTSISAHEIRPASSLPAQSTKQSFHERADVEIPQSSPIRIAEAPVHEVIGHELRAFEMGTEAAIEEEWDTVDLPRHRVKPIQVETQLVGLEEHHTSSTDSTDPVSPRDPDEHTPDLLARRSPSPETPIVVSSRSLKKRKSRHESTQATPASKVKTEVITSSPIGLSHFLPPNESLDLDDIGEKVNTPRKHRRLQEELSRQKSRGPLQSLSSTNYRNGDGGQGRIELNGSLLNSTVNNTPNRVTPSVLQSRSTNQKVLPRTSEGSAPKKRRIASNKDVETLMEDGEFGTSTRGKDQGSKQGGRLIDLLTKPSPPRQAISPARAYATNQQPAGVYRSNTTSGLAREITKLPAQESVSRSSLIRRAEDSLTRPKVKDSRDRNARSPTSSMPSSKGSIAGQIESSRPSSRGTSRTSVEPPRPVSRGSRRGSLEPIVISRISPRKFKEVPRASDPPGQSPPPSSMSEFLPPRRDLPLIVTPRPQLNMQVSVNLTKSSTKKKNDTSSARRSRMYNPNDITFEDWEMDPDQEPLRSRPVEKLSLQDFKVNANYNQGHDYAFREVVRGKDARHALQGCTKPDCCGGKFRALAEINTTNAPTPSQEERDDELLREYMGDNFYRLRNMSKVDRHEILLQAKTREISERHGKHRHAYVRPASPPGFWSNDFPTTQEQRADMEMVKEKERALVVERYNEAMRPGGKFIFRDE